LGLVRCFNLTTDCYSFGATKKGSLPNFHHKTISPFALSCLDEFVRRGGGVLAIHSATASFKQEPRYFEILGGRFRMHGAVEIFTVYQTRTADEVFGALAPFQIRDELYIHELEPEITIHFETMHEGQSVPVVWTRREPRLLCCAGAHRREYEAPDGTRYFETRPDVGMSKLRLGIVGCGDIAGFTALVSKLVPPLQLAACCDVDAERVTGMSNKEVAEALLISTYTVQVHLRNIFGKLGVDSRTEAAAYALSQGWIKPEGNSTMQRLRLRYQVTLATFLPLVIFAMLSAGVVGYALRKIPSDLIP
jgi:hypothetical protein